MKLPPWFASTFGVVVPQEPSLEEENQKIKTLAADFDQLTLCPGWGKAAQFLAEKVDAAIATATTTEDSRDVIRWNAKRGMLDDLLAHISETKRQRDEIVEMERDITNVGNNNAN